MRAKAAIARVLFAALVIALRAAQAAQPATVAIEPVKVGAHSRYVQGFPGQISHQNQG